MACIEKFSELCIFKEFIYRYVRNINSVYHSNRKKRLICVEFRIKPPHA